MSELSELNQKLNRNSPQVFEMLSSNGRKALFPKQGIVSQSLEAAETKLNATVGQAFENDRTPMILESLSKQANLPKESFLYSPSCGKGELRNLWKSMMLKKNSSIKSKITLPVAVNGITHGLYVAGKLFVDKNDEIIIPDRMWTNYELIFSQAKLNTFPMFDKGGLNLNAITEKLKGKGKKILLLNFSHNPTGYTITKKEAEKLLSIIKESANNSNILVILDDAYFGLVYEENVFQESLFGHLASLHKNVLAIKVDGMTKEAFAWGLRVGFVTYGFKGLNDASAEVLENKTIGAVRATISNISTLSQDIAYNALSSSDFWAQRAQKYALLREKYEAVKKAIKNGKYAPFFEALPFNSGYFMCVRLKKHDADKVRLCLLKNHSTGVIAFGDAIRIAYSAVPLDDVPKVFENLYLACKES